MRKLIYLCLALAVLSVPGGSASQAAPLIAPAVDTVDWWTVDGGGGTSRGGAYAVSGTAGQPDSGAEMSGGTYTLTGGFWNGVVHGLSGYRPFGLSFPLVSR